jgi:hypothetical protein
MRGAALAALALLPPGPRPIAPRHATVVIPYRRGHPLNRFDPTIALGGALDGHEQGDARLIYTPRNVQAMLSAGLGPVSYRLRTELAVDAWHWNPRGTWSDSAHARGYWTSSAAPGAPIEVSYGYHLPRRGNTIDQANNDGYSRLDDGDTTTFWKTNPYLDSRYTHVPDAEHPQWVVVDFGHPVAVNAVRILWGEPFARRTLVAWWKGASNTSIDHNPVGGWVAFPGNDPPRDRGGIETRRLIDQPVTTRFIRLTLLDPSRTAPRGSSDARDSLGFAIRELAAGTLDAAGRFHDAVRHALSAPRQTRMNTSSTDPWHRSTDRDSLVEQPGIDLVFSSGLTRGKPLLLPVGTVYDTPDNARALLAYVKARGYPISGVEAGEEPDGQFMTPEDYAALYVQTVDGLHAVDPTVRVGGPGWQDALNSEVAAWPDPGPSKGGWIGRFMRYLEHHGRADAFALFTFEWYPFDNACTRAGPQLDSANALLRSSIARLRSAGVPERIPWIITEYGYSAHAGPAEVGMEAALFNADAVANFLALGGDQAYLYGYEPTYPEHERTCPSWGNNMMFVADSEGQASAPTATYWGTRLLTRAWADSTGGSHEIYPARVESTEAVPAGRAPTAYAVLRPDGQWGVLLINHDVGSSWSVDLKFEGEDAGALTCPREEWRYDDRQYRWHAAGPEGHPIRSDPPRHVRVSSCPNSEVLLRPRSLTVLVGRGPR